MNLIRKTALLATSLLFCCFLRAQIINTIAGNGTGGNTGDNGPALSAELNNPTGVVFDSIENLYVADNANNTIRRIDAISGIITTIAGTGIEGYSGDNGPATSAELYFPFGLAISKQGDIYISDLDNQVIRKISISNGVITTFAGRGVQGFYGDGESADSAEFLFPAGITFDSLENLYITDQFNNRVRKVTYSTHIISTFAGNGNSSGANGDGGLATNAIIVAPEDIKFDKFGNAFIADGANYVRRIDGITGIITSVAGNGGDGYSGDGGPATNAEIDTPLGIAIDASENIYFSDVQNAEVRKVTYSTGIITEVAGLSVNCGYSGDGGPASSAEICWPGFLALNKAGDLYFADQFNNRIRKITNLEGIKSIEAAEYIHLFPNPVTNGIFFISIANPEFTSGLISIYSVLGECILTEEFHSTSGLVKVDAPTLPQGVYLVKLQSYNGNSTACKLVITKT